MLTRARTRAMRLGVAAAALFVTVALAGCLPPVFCDRWLAYVWWEQEGMYDAFGGAPAELGVQEEPLRAGLAFSHSEIERRWPRHALTGIHGREGEIEGGVHAPNLTGEPAFLSFDEPAENRAELDAFLARVFDASAAEREALAEDLIAEQARRRAAGEIDYGVAYGTTQLPTRGGALWEELLREHEEPPKGLVHSGTFADLGWDDWTFSFHVPYRNVSLPLEAPTHVVEARADGLVIIGRQHIVDGHLDYRTALGLRSAEAREWASVELPRAGLPAPVFENFTTIPMSGCSEAYYPEPLGVEIT